MWTILINFLFSRTGLIVMAVLLVLGIIGGYKIQTAYWKHKAQKAEAKAEVAETRATLKEIEVSYAPDIQAMERIAKRSKLVRRPQRKTEPEPQPVQLSPEETQNYRDAAAVADTINRLWGHNGLHRQTRKTGLRSPGS